MSNLQQACIAYSQQWISELPENPPMPNYSKKYKRFEKKLLDKMRDDRYHYFTRKTMTVLVAAAIIASLITTVFAVPQTRAYILDELADHSIFRSLIEPTEKFDNTINCGYIPEGFEKTYEYYGDIHSMLEYCNDNLILKIDKAENGAEFGTDNEETKKEIILHNGNEYILYEKENGAIRIVWCDLNYTYRIAGDISLEEALKIAENIQ